MSVHILEHYRLSNGLKKRIMWLDATIIEFSTRKVLYQPSPFKLKLRTKAEIEFERELSELEFLERDLREGAKALHSSAPERNLSDILGW